MEEARREGRCAVSAPGKKYDDGKTLWHLLPWKAVEQVVRVLEYGVRKYGVEGGWMTVPNGKARYEDAHLRHAIERQNGETTDKESGLLHSAHMACNAIFLIAFDLGLCGAPVAPRPEPEQPLPDWARPPYTPKIGDRVRVVYKLGSLFADRTGTVVSVRGVDGEHRTAIKPDDNPEVPRTCADLKCCAKSVELLEGGAQ